MAHFNVNPSSSDYLNWEKRLELYYEKQIFEKECQLKVNLERIKKEYQVKMVALELEVKKQKLLHVVNGEPGRDVAMQPVVGETTTCFPGGDTTTVPSHSLNLADTNPQPPITTLSNTYSPHITHDDVVQVNADTLPLQSFSVTPTTDSSTAPQSHSFDSADPNILTQPHLFDSADTNHSYPAQAHSLESATTDPIFAQPYRFDGSRAISISCNVSLCGQSVGTNLQVVPAQSHTSSVPPDMSTTDNQSDDQSDSLVTPAQTRMTNTPLNTPTTTSSTGSFSLCPSSAKSSVALDNTLSGGPPTGIPFHYLNSDIQQPIYVTTPTHSASPPGVHVSCPQPANSTLLVQELCDPFDMNSYQSGLLGNAFPRGYSTLVYQAPDTTSWATQGDKNDWPPFKMLGHHACHILNHDYTLMRDKLSHIFDHNDVPPNIKPPFNRIFCARNMPLTYPTSCSSIECFMFFCSFFDTVSLSCHSSLREDISQSSTFGLHPFLLPIGNCVRFILALSWQTILSYLKRFMLAQSWQMILSYLRRFMLALSWKMISSHFWISSRWVQSKIWRFNHSLPFCL